MCRIDIDDEVYGELERHAKGFEQPNDVLRRLLLKGEGKAPAVAAEVVGRLEGLIQSGAVEAGDRLVHRQVRKGRSFEATVTERGAVTTSMGMYQAPSPALADLVGSQIDGWSNWLHARSGKTLKELRDSLG